MEYNQVLSKSTLRLVNICLATLILPMVVVGDSTPEDTVVGYVNAFKTKDDEGLSNRLHDEFMASFKSKYSQTLARYPADKKAAACQMFGVTTVDEVAKLDGREMFRRFMKHPSAARMWTVFDKITLDKGALTVVEKTDADATVDFPMTASRGAQQRTAVTRFQLRKVEDDWQIASFSKFLK